MKAACPRTSAGRGGCSAPSAGAEKQRRQAQAQAQGTKPRYKPRALPMQLDSGWVAQVQQCAQQCRGQVRPCQSCLAKALTDAVPGQGRDDLNKVFQANHQQMRYHQKKKNRMVGQQNRRATKALKLQADRETLENLLKPWRTHEPEPCVNLVPSLSKFQVLQVLLTKVDKEIEKNTLKEFAAARQISTHTRHLVELWGCSRL